MSIEDSTSSDGTVVVVRDAEVLAEAAAARLLTRVVDAQALRGSASVVLTGGGVGIAVLDAVGAYRGMQGPPQPDTYLIGAAVPIAEQTYFVKLIAPGAGAPVQRDAFLAFLKSLRIER